MRKIVGLMILVVAGIAMGFVFPKANDNNVETVAKADAVGIKFSDLTYEAALKLSQKTGKPVFIDCYTVWCGPCKHLSKNTFTNKEVGEFFNENFINLKVEMEKDADGPELARLFKVRAYPTLVFVNGKGELIKQSLGYVTPEQLLVVAKEVAGTSGSKSSKRK